MFSLFSLCSSILLSKNTRPWLNEVQWSVKQTVTEGKKILIISGDLLKGEKLLADCKCKLSTLRQSGCCRWTKTSLQVRSAAVEPRVTMVVAREPEWGLLKPGWGLSLPAATWHRPRAHGPIMQAWPRKPEQGRDSSIPQQASFSRQT